jgi:hypothetical protein
MPLKTWMASLGDGCKLNEICMPGSHDACMYEVCPGNESKVDDTVTQFHTIGEQLDLGTRFFDIRVYLDNQTLRPGHFMKKNKSDAFGSYGPLFSSVLADFQSFARSNPSETVIIKFSTSSHAHKAAIQEIESALGGLLFTSKTAQNLARAQLGELRGKIVAVFEEKEGTSGGLHLVSKKTPTTNKEDLAGQGGRSVLWLRGDAPIENRLKAVVSSQIEAAATPVPNLAAHLEMRYLTITASKRDALNPLENRMSVIDNTARQFELNPAPRPNRGKLQSVYGSWANGDHARRHYWDLAVRELWNQHKGRVNIFMYDFINADVNEMLIKLNELNDN